jgi:hypothetical protein
MSRRGIRLWLHSLEDRTAPTVVNWTGAANDSQWTTATNWSSNAVPGAGDDVSIINPSSGYVTYSGGATSINSLTLQGGDLRVAWYSTGSMAVTNGMQVTKSGSLSVGVGGTATFIENGATNIAGGSFTADGTSTVTLNGLTTIAATANSSTTLQTADTGHLNAPNLVSVTGPISATLSIGSYGGTIDIHSLTSLTSFSTSLGAANPGAVINASSLATINLNVGGNSSAIYAPSSGGQILVSPALTKIDGVDLSVGGPSSFPTGQLTDITNCSVNVDASNDFSMVSNFKNSSITLYNASTVTFTNLSTWAITNSASVSATANSGAKLSFPALTTVTPSSNGLGINAYGGSSVSLAILTKITSTNGAVYLIADGTGSVLDMPSLTTLTDGFSRVGATNDGQIHFAPAFHTLVNNDFVLDTAAGFSVGQLTSVSNSSVTIRGETAAFTNLTSITNTLVHATNMGTKANFPALTTLNSSSADSISVDSGSTVSAANLTSIAGTTDLRSDGVGSVIDLPVLAGIIITSGNTGSIAAVNGGQIHVATGLTTLNRINLQVDTAAGFPVGQLTSVSNSSLYVQGDNVTFTNLTAATNSQLEADNTGTSAYFPVFNSVVANNGNTAVLKVTAGGLLSAPALNGINSGNLQLWAGDTGSALNLPNLATLTFSAGAGGAIYAQNGGHITVSAGITSLNATILQMDAASAFPANQLTSVGNSTIDVTGGNVMFTSLALATNCQIEAEGGAVASFPVLSNVVASAGMISSLSAYSGAQLHLPVLTTINTGADLRSQDFSVLDLPALTTVTPAVNAPFGNLFVTNGGKLNTSSSLHLSNLSFAFDDTAQFNFANLQLDAGTTTTGFGKLPGNVVNGGLLALNLNYPETLQIGGNYTQTASSTLNINLAGTTQGTQYDWLNVGGAATLNGTLSVSLLSGYQPALGDLFTPITALNRSGGFVHYEFPAPFVGLQLLPQYGLANVKLQAVAVTAPPQVGGLVVNDGAIQRSRVTKISIDFNQIVSLHAATPADAFQLMRQSDNAQVGLTAAVTTDTVTHVVLTFTGSTSDFGSIQDGRYTLTVMAGSVSNTGGLSLDGNGDCTGGDDYTMIGNPATNKLFRLYGDVNGDGNVTASDFNVFRQYFGGYLAAFDFDGDGTVAASDFIQFRLRFGGSI